MIWALLALYFLGGAVSSGATLTSADVGKLQSEVAAVVADDVRSANAREILAGLRKDAKAFEKAYAKSGRRLNKLYQAHVDNRQEALKILDDLNAAWESGQLRALDARFALRDELTESEWASLFGAK